MTLHELNRVTPPLTQEQQDGLQRRQREDKAKKLALEEEERAHELERRRLQREGEPCLMEHRLQELRGLLARIDQRRRKL